MDPIKTTLTTRPKPKPDDSQLGFGKFFTDHMLLIDYNSEKGWHDGRIEPYGPLQLDPATTCLHYAQLIFEGLKAYRTPQDKIVMFRPEENMKRMCRSGERMCIPPVDVDYMTKAMAELVKLDRDWVPKSPGTSLYVRPFIISTDTFLGVHPSDSYLFSVILSPVGSYYSKGLAPIRIYVEDKYVRSVKGGTGFAKFAGNYASSLRGQVEAEAQGFDQVLWLDGVDRRSIEEVGSMNVFFVIGDEVVTPELSGSILPGITRMSAIELLNSWGVKVSERRITVDELAAAYERGELREAFGAGTAAVISPIGELRIDGKSLHINNGEIGEVSRRLYDELTGIQTCTRPDPFGWVYEVD